MGPTSQRQSNTEFSSLGRTRLEPLHQGPIFSSSGELDPVVCVSVLCYNIVEKYGLHALGMDFLMGGPKHIFDVFCGNIPNSLEAEWLDHETTLKSIVIQAYRVSYKILVDQVTLVGSEYSMEELSVIYSKLLIFARAHYRKHMMNGLLVQKHLRKQTQVMNGKSKFLGKERIFSP